MWVIINSESKVIATINVKPCPDDLATRNEQGIDVGNAVVSIGDRYDKETNEFIKSSDLK